MSNAIKAAMQRSYAYVFTTLPINHIQDEFYETLKRMCLSLADTAVALTYVLMYLGLIFAKLVILVFPHAVKLGKVIVDFHATKLSRSDLILEGTSIAILVTCFVFRVRIQSAWKNFIKSVSAKSKVAARAAPHVLFFTAAVTFAILGRNFLIPLTHSAVMPVFTLILPLVATTRVLFQIKNMSEAECLEAINTKNLLWVIVAIYHSLVTFGSLIPFGSKMLTFLPYAKEMVIVVMVWVQLSPVFSKIVFESVISKIMVKLCGMLPAGYGVEQTNAKTGTFLSVLKMMYLVNDSQMSFLQALFQDTVATMLAIVCIFMPNPFATIGMVMIALLLPAFRTSSVVATASGSSGSSHELAKLARRRPESGGAGGGGGRVGSNAKEHSTGSSGLGVDHVLSTHWLRYWVCLSVLWCLRIYAVKMWPSIVIVTTLWLQHSYFQGSSKATSFIVDAAKAINERNKRIELERQGVVRTPQPAIAATPGGSRFTFAALFSRTPKKPINYDPDDEILTPIVESTRNRGANTRDSKDILESNEIEEAEGNLASGYDIAINEHKTYGESNDVGEPVTGFGLFSPGWGGRRNKSVAHTTAVNATKPPVTPISNAAAVPAVGTVAVSTAVLTETVSVEELEEDGEEGSKSSVSSTPVRVTQSSGTTSSSSNAKGRKRGGGSASKKEQDSASDYQRPANSGRRTKKRNPKLD